MERHSLCAADISWPNEGTFDDMKKAFLIAWKIFRQKWFAFSLYKRSFRIYVSRTGNQGHGKSRSILPPLGQSENTNVVDLSFQYLSLTEYTNNFFLLHHDVFEQ